MPIRSDATARASYSVAAVLLLLAFSYSAALTGPGGPLTGDGDGPLSLVEADHELRSVLETCLDRSISTAMELAVDGPSLDLASALDAAFRRELREAMPGEVSGWRATLLGTSAGLNPRPDACTGPGTARGRWAPLGEAWVELRSLESRGPAPIRLRVAVEGPPDSPNHLAARAGALVDALSNSSGPVAYVSSSLLWEVGQGRALSGARDPSAILEDGDVRSALEAAVSLACGGGPLPPPSCPHIDLRHLVRQSLEGVLESNVGWLDDYLMMGDGLAGFLSVDGALEPFVPLLAGLEVAWSVEGAIRSLAAEALSGITWGVVEHLTGEVGRWEVQGGSLEQTVTSGIERIDELSRELQTALRREVAWASAGLDLARGAVGGLLDALGREGGTGPPNSLLGILEAMLEGAEGRGGALSVLAAHASRAIAACAIATSALGLASARDSLSAMRAMGREVAVQPADGGPYAGDLDVDLEVRSVEASWSGQLSWRRGGPEGWSLDEVLASEGPIDVAMGATPYASTCSVRVTGSALVGATASGASGGDVLATWEVPLDLVMTVPIATGWALEGVGYAPCSTLCGDVAAVVGAVFDLAGDSVGWLVHRVEDAGEWVMAQLRGLWEDMVESVLAESAYTLSRALWSIGESLVQRRLNDAFNDTWDLLIDLFGDDLQERLSWGFDVFGTELRVSIDPELMQLELGCELDHTSVSVVLRRLCEPYPPFRTKSLEGFYWGVFGEVVLDLGGPGAVLYLDPLTLDRPAVLTLVARWGGDGDGGGSELVVEALEARPATDRADIRLSDLLSGARVLSLGGMGTVVDAGLALHGDDIGPKGLRDLALEALKEAWLATVRGWHVGDLLGVTGAPPEPGLFLETLFRELHQALVEEGERAVTEVEAFVEVDPPAPGWPDLRLSLVIQRPLEVLLPLQAWVARALAPLVGSALSGSVSGAGDGLATTVAERLLVRFELVWGLDAPPLPMADGARARDPPVALVVRGQANLASVGAMAGKDWGRWEASLEVGLRGVPGAALALVPGMGSRDWDRTDLCLLRLVVRDRSTPRLLVSQVLYDAAGRDLDLEFVELVNAGRRVVDLEGWRIEDSSGGFLVQAHVPLLPGDHLLLARNETAIRDEWGVMADVAGLSVRLANDGDLVRLVSPGGAMADVVSWEGHLEGWEDLGAREGEALVRLEGDVRVGEVAAWRVAMPSPRRTGW